MTDYIKKFRLDGKNAVVCGGLGLIGKEITNALAQSGAKVIVLDINAELGKTFEKECRAKKLNVDFIRFDVSKFDSYKNTLSKLFQTNGKIDIFVNSSYPHAKIWGQKIEDVKTETWKENIDIHMNSYCLLTRDIAELMKKNNVKGSIINYGSMYGVVGPDFGVYEGTNLPNDGQYAAIKGGIINFTRYIASYYGKDGIRANSLCPGGVFDNQNPVFVKNYEKRTLLKRMGNKDEMASVTLFLASDASSYMTGTTIMVDGGWTAI